MDQQEKDIIRGIYPDVPEPDFEHFIAVVERTGLTPLSSPRQIYLVGRRTKIPRTSPPEYQTTYTVQTGIDGLRIVAARTGVHAGTDDVEYKGKVALNSNRDAPQIARITVWKMVKGKRVPFSASVRWNEFYPGEGKSRIWDTKSYHMLGKCSEALGLRRGFPQDLSGLYIAEEFDQADLVDLASITADKANPDMAVAQQLRARGKTDPELGYDGVLIAVQEAADALGHDRPSDVRGIGIMEDAVLDQALDILDNPDERQRIIDLMRPFDEEIPAEVEQGQLV